MFARILIANRGEIACRVIASCERLGIETVAVHSDADRQAMHVKRADTAIRLGGPRASDSYLDMDKVIAAARDSGAQAIHPGYGFLAENADFARACEDAGLVFIGPTADTIDSMGSKIASKRIMEAAGVPCIPGYHGDDQSDATLLAEAGRIGFPLLVKASAGGGGKGMRIVHDGDGFREALAGARREAQAAFGDDRVLLERFVEDPHHIEFQVFGDAHGRVVHLFERECSIQRRYQKIVEEAPSPLLDAGLRERMGEAAVAAARAVGYRNAGTVEFIVGRGGEFHFMEMNTRLQVEHPVTELVTGLDLVEWQLRVAAGEPLPIAQEDLRRHGHAIEVRIYAENPDRGFVPAVGRIRRFEVPTDIAGVRVDTGVGDGDEISAFYDPMIAKLCVHADDRADAVMKLRAVLDRTAVFGLTTNLPLLRAIARNDTFAAGAYDTGFVEQHLEALLASPGPAPQPVLDTAAAFVAAGQANGLRASRAHDPGSPWMHIADHRMHFTAHGQDTVVVDTSSLELAVGGISVIGDGQDLLVADGEGAWDLSWQPAYPVTPGVADDEAHPGSPMPGRIVAIHCKPGDRVKAGQALLVLEAMKMEYTLQARTDGVIERIHFGIGDMVDAEVPLVDIA